MASDSAVWRSGSLLQSAARKPGRRQFVATAVLASLSSSTARAQAPWPDKPIRFIVPFPPGGNSDVLGRTLADRLKEVLGANLVVENKPGGTTQIGTEAVARAEPDGYTMLLVAATAFTVLPNLRKLNFDLSGNFEMVGGVADYVPIVTVRNGLGVKTLGDFVKLARRQSGKLTWGSAGLASAGHIYGEMLKQQTGIDILHVPFKGSADLITGLLGDQIDMIIDGVGLALARSGRATALATFFNQRHPELPDVPSLPETGLKIDLPAGGWGVAFPRHTAPAIVTRMAAALEKILAEAPTKDRLLRASVVAQWVPPAEYRDALIRARSYYGDLFKAIGLKAEA